MEARRECRYAPQSWCPVALVVLAVRVTLVLPPGLVALAVLKLYVVLARVIRRVLSVLVVQIERPAPVRLISRISRASIPVLQAPVIPLVVVEPVAHVLIVRLARLPAPVGPFARITSHTRIATSTSATLVFTLRLLNYFFHDSI